LTLYFFHSFSKKYYFCISGTLFLAIFVKKKS